MKNRAGFYFLPLLILFVSLVKGQSIHRQQLDSALATLVKTGEPGFSVAVVHRGKLAYTQSFGLADVKTNRKNSILTPFNIASMGKQFTAACIYLLEQKGQLNTNDKLSKYFPKLPPYAESITISHLIHHQNGLRDYITLIWLPDMDENTAYDDTEVYDMLSRQKALNFVPGSQFSYSNSGYYFLARIVKQVSGMDLQEFAGRYIFKPLRMTHTGYSRTHQIAGKANGYVLENDIFDDSNPKNSTIGQGNVYSVVTDFQKWFQEMKDHKVLGEAVWQKMLTPASTSGGEPTKYGGGLKIGNYNGKEAISHGGDISGYHSGMYYLPKEDLGVVVLGNNDNIHGPAVYNVIFNTLYKQAQAPPRETVKATPKIPLSAVRLDSSRYVGHYTFDSDSTLNMEVNVKDSKIMMYQIWNEEEYPIEPYNDSLFYVKGVEGIIFGFHDIINGKANKMVIDQNNRLTSCTRTNKKLSIDKESVNELTGRFYSSEIDARYVLINDNGKLKVKIGSTEFKTSHSQGKETFNILGNGMKLVIHRNEHAIVDGFDLIHVRVNKLRFVKE